MLYLVPTPIGNLRDITLRALDVLKEADVILCEDTRRTKILLDYYGIVGKGRLSPPAGRLPAGEAGRGAGKGLRQGGTPPLQSFHEHNERSQVQKIIQMLEAGKTLAVVSESGMPLISDPGYPLVRELIRRGLPFEVLPGPNAALTALVASGLAVDAFSFFGFLPQKSSARKKVLEKLKEKEETLIFYESPYRVLETLEEMKEVFGDREAVLAREMTKKFEEFVRGRLNGIIERFSKGKVLGEFVILVSGKGRKEAF